MDVLVELEGSQRHKLSYAAKAIERCLSAFVLKMLLTETDLLTGDSGYTF